MSGCEYSVMITGIACALAKEKSCDEISLLAAFFTQLGDTLATLAVYHDVCCSEDEIETTGIEAV